MARFKTGSHTVYDLRYHVIWCTKYRYKVLTGDIATRCRDLIREICMAKEIEIISGKVSKDHVHMYLSIPPKMPVSRALQFIKGKSSRKMLHEFRALSKRYWGQHLWARGYFASSIGEINDKAIRDYIESQDEHHNNDDFTVDV